MGDTRPSGEGPITTVDFRSWAVRLGTGGQWAQKHGFHLAVLALVAAVGLAPRDLSPFLALSLPDAPRAVVIGGAMDEPRLRLQRSGLVNVAPQGERVLGRSAVVTTSEGQYPQYEPRVYVVQPGDTLSMLAQALGVSQKTLIWANESLLERRDSLAVGQELTVLPVDGAIHRVVEGDTLASLAEKYRVTAEDIERYPSNDIADGGLLIVGSTLVIPGAELPDPPVRVVPPPAPAQPVTREAPAVEGTAGSGSMTWPLNGLLTSGYSSYHRAIDIHTKAGVPVVAADGGTVTLVSWQTYSYGYHVIIDHGDGVETLYAHLSAINVEAGQVVAKGEQVGAVGSTGRSTGPHLHFEVRVNGSQQNPFSYLP